MRLASSTARVIGIGLLLTIIVGMAGCGEGASPARPATEAEKQKIDQEMRKMQEKATKTKKNR